jgi:hypothetical protein
MVDGNAVTRYPDPLFTLLQASSWDRAELNKQDKASWFANKDYGYYLRLDTNGGRKEYVIMEAKGPGAITRWWIPQEQSLDQRIVRVYLDDNPQPVIEENYQNFINGSSFVKWPFAFTSSDEKDTKYQYGLPVGLRQMGAGFYLPIPFSKACKVTLDADPFYYAIDYRMYREGTKVQSFTKEMDKSMDLVDSAGQTLLAKNNLSAFSSQKTAVLSKNQQVEMDMPSGEHSINNMYLKINSKANKQMNQAAILQIIFDGKQTVWSPVSSFFGGGVYANPVKNRNTEVTEDGWMISNWVMPYKKDAKMILKNFGEEPITVTWKVSVKDYSWDNNSMYFHADWHEEAPLNTPPAKDWNYIEIKGKGLYVGDVLTVHSLPKSWWGEGDEKIYIDNDTFPNHLGTGLEDYYGYAWGVANFFNSPFISMPLRDARGKDDWRGYNTMERMRLLDDIPFNNSLRVDMEAMNTQPGVSFSVACFWYGMPGDETNIKPDEKTIVRKLQDFEPAKILKAPGEVFPDPASNHSLLEHPSKKVSYVGDQLDLLNWRDKNVVKTCDADGDNVLGTAGYTFFGGQIVDMKGIRKDSVSALPNFITSFTSLPVHAGFGNACLFFPEKRSEIHFTGLLEARGDLAKKGLVSFAIGKNPPSTFRLGIMLDNAGSFEKVGKSLWVTNSTGGDSGKVLLAKSNRIPDWYFFDLSQVKTGDRITIHGLTEKDNDIFSIGAITFDVNNNK